MLPLLPSCSRASNNACRQTHDARALCIALDVVEAEVRQDGRLHNLRQQHHHRPQAAAQRVEQVAVALQQLQDPMRAAEEAAEAQAEHVVCRETLDHLAVLHHAQLREHTDGLQVYTHRPQDLQCATAAATPTSARTGRGGWLAAMRRDACALVVWVAIVQFQAAEALPKQHMYAVIGAGVGNHAPGHNARPAPALHSTVLPTAGPCCWNTYCWAMATAAAAVSAAIPVDVPSAALTLKMIQCEVKGCAMAAITTQGITT
eukprot:GHRQ01010157.1.p1 GENE.GHRQ01010157.1~~GHRQ01010157.1.p1  ORF type:complete len:260 (-),score=48.85 GHRQ01010157.1:693-1472(-)